MSRRDARAALLPVRNTPDNGEPIALRLREETNLTVDQSQVTRHGRDSNSTGRLALVISIDISELRHEL